MFRPYTDVIIIAALGVATFTFLARVTHRPNNWEPEPYSYQKDPHYKTNSKMFNYTHDQINKLKPPTTGVLVHCSDCEVSAVCIAILEPYSRTEWNVVISGTTTVWTETKVLDFKTKWRTLDDKPCE